MKFAQRIFRSIDVPDELMKCAKWSNIATKLVDKGYIESEFEFAGMSMTSEHIIMDIVDSDILPIGTTMAVFDLIKDAIHKAIIGGYHIKYAFALLTAVSILFWPYRIITFMMNTFLRYVADIKDNPGILFSREWAPWTRYKYREHYELDHELGARLNKAHILSDEYISEFPSPIIESCATWITWLISICIIILFIEKSNYDGYNSLINDMKIRVIALLFIAYTFFRGFRGVEGKLYNPSRVYTDLCSLMQLEHTMDNPLLAKKAVLDIYRRKYDILIYEFISILIMPIYLAHCAYIWADNIQEIINQNIIVVGNGSKKYFIHRASRPSDDFAMTNRMQMSFMNFSTRNADTFSSMLISKRFEGNYV
jgi:hypothetical protein